jgi:hypothetical protein
MPTGRSRSAILLLGDGDVNADGDEDVDAAYQPDWVTKELLNPGGITCSCGQRPTVFFVCFRTGNAGQWMEQMCRTCSDAYAGARPTHEWDGETWVPRT